MSFGSGRKRGCEWDEPEYNVGSSITSSSVASNASDMSNVLVPVSPISSPTQASKLNPQI